MTQHVSCNGGNDGRATVESNGGTTPITFDWGGVNRNQLSAGTYVVTVNDYFGSSTCSVTITEPDPLTCNTTVVQNVSCNGLSDGQASVLGSGGTSPYTYNWGGYDENALAAGTYVVTVTDANGCTNTCDVTITEPAVLTCSTTIIQNVSCNGLSDGQASVLGNGGTSPYSYNWGGFDPNALAPGTYTVTVTDADGCTNSCDATITEPTVLTCSTTLINNVSCNGLSDGQASVLGSGGTSPYTYNWGGYDENALAAGTYVVTVTDANGCTNTCDVTITEPTMLSCSTTLINNVSCNGLSDGQASVLGNGGTSPYSYNWGGYDENALAAGTYVVTVTDANGCTNTCDVTITEPAVLTCGTTVVSHVTCNGLSDGQASVLGSGGTSPYTYNWGGYDENALAAGTYVVTVTDANGCINTCDVTITEPVILTCSTTVVQNVTCNGLSDGQASVLGIGGTSPYSYNWGGFDPNALAPGTFIVTVTDANGCTNSCDVTITEPTVLTCSTTLINNVSCNGLSDGQASVLGSGGTSPYAYNWGGYDENALAAGTYVVTVTDANGCTNTCDVTITEPTVLSCSTTLINNVSCNGLSDGQASVLGSGGTSPYTYNWGGANENALTVGSYVVTVTDANGCTNTCDVTITEPVVLACSTTVVQNVTCNGLSDGQASVLGSGGTSPYTYNWGGYDENALAAGTYVVTVTDANGCTNTCDVTITEPVVLTCSTTVVSHVTCNGLSDGQASVLGSGGTSPYSYNWGGEDENALSAGTYVVTVTDANGCTNTCDVMITAPAVLTCSTTVISHVSCNGLSDGQAGVLGSGGTSPYSYNWGGEDKNALSAGTYIVTVTDANGCTNTCNVTITEPAVLTCSTTVISHVSCNGLSDGQASVLGSGGTSPYSYNWGGEDENALSAGTYVVTVTDANGCTNTCEVTITEPAVLTCSTTVISHVSCNGLSDGQAGALGSGGTSPYIYNWGGEDENALPAGTYVVTVTDANGCTNTCDVTITEPAVLTCSTTVVSHVSCNGLSDGQASVSGSGGTSPYTYNWGGADENALAAGTYVVTVTDANGCATTCDVTITEPTVLTCGTTVINNVSCNGLSDGQASAMASGGTSPYNYNWGGEDENALAAGTYVVTVTDANGCTNTCDVVITEPDALACSTAAMQNVSCNGMNDGQAAVVSFGGTSPYSYDWGSEDENALAAGTYVVTVTDANGCTNTCDVTITEPSVLTCSTTVVSHVSCNGLSDGRASVFGSGGTAPYSYNWGGEDENALAAGTYVVTVTDANGCTNTCDVEITEPAVLTCSTTVINNVSCNGLSDGQASAMASGGTSPYSYNWGGEDENALAAGTYVVTVTDANGCTNTCDIEITEPSVLTCSTTVINNVSCNGLSDGQASVLASGGTSPYSYNWGGADENALAAGTYVVIVTDANGCTNTCDVVITEPSVLTCSTTVVSHVSCNGLSDGRASVLGSGGTAPYSYNWGGEDENALAAGTYVVTVTDANGCTNTCDVEITEPAVLTCSTTVINNVSCNGLSDGQASAMASGGTSPYSYNWGGEDENALAAGTYVVTVTDANGCTNTCDIEITEPSVLTCSTTVINNVSCNGLSDGQASVLASGGTSPYSYNWGGADENALAAGTYVVIVTDANGCTNTCDVVITEPTVLTCNTTVINNVSCNGLSDGQASVIGSGGTSPYSYDWGGEDENALATGTYVVTVTDANGCTNTCDVTITEPAVLTCSTTVINNVSCNGLSDGQAGVLGSGGTAPYTYNWGGEDENALSAGAYVVTVTDANGCTNTCDVTITEPAVLSCSTTVVSHVSCNGLSDGQASVLGSGDTSPYSYNWGGADENALAAGTYVVTVTDANGCTNTCDVTITEPAVLTCSTTVVSHVSCNGLSDGRASVLGSGGTAPYNYNWGGEDENALAAGTYVVTVTDANGCTNTCDVVITEPDALSCNTTVINHVSCNGLSDGQASVLASGGTSPYSYDWGGEDENALAAGTYVVTVTDANGCTNTCDVEITEPTVLTCNTIIISHVSCNGLSDGQASVLGSGGTSPYSYNWGGEDKNALAAGTYVVTVTDANGCTNTCDVVIIEPAILSCNTTVINNVSCNGLSDGQASVLGSGGTAPYSYNWGGEDENALAAGTYVVTVTDANGCTNTCDVVITEPAVLTCSTTVVSHVSCNGLSDGQAGVLGSGGTAPYTYNWGGEDENALAAGTYVVTVTDANGCTNTCDVVITEPAVLSCSTTVINNVSCNGLSDGQASVLASGGTSPYSYNWGGEDENALSAGTYIVTVTDANGCTNTCDVVITEPAVLTCSTTVINNVSCNGLSDGQASVSSSGGTSPYSYNWGGEDENALAAGTYVVTVTDANGCTNTCDVTITEPAVLSCSTTVVSHVSCNGLSDGRASVLAIGGTSPYNYNWGGEEENALSAGAYIVTVTDANGCTNTCDVVITEPAVLTCSSTVINNVSCNGLSDGQVSVLASGGTSPYSYNWGGEDENALSAGTYIVTVTDANGCTNTCDVVITEPAVLTCSSTVINNVSCNGLSDGQASVLASGGTAPYSYNWGGEDENALAAGTYVVTVTDANGCTNTCDVVITEPAVLTCSTTVINNVSCNGLSDGQASVLASGGTSPYSYNWGGEDKNALAAGSYVVTVTDSNGCTNTCDVVITEPAVLTCSTTVTNHVSCNGLSDGHASVTASGGQAPYIYDWGNANPLALAAGDYVITVTDLQGCTNTCEVTITEPDALSCSASVIQNVSCYGANDGQASVSATGGTAPYTYDWGGADSNALSAGTYYITIVDQQGCSNVCSVVITEPAQILNCEITLIQNITCSGCSDGQASVSATGGTAPYTYDWGGANPNALPAGTFTVTVTDSNSCTSTCSVNLYSPDELVCDIEVAIELDCEQGTAQVTPNVTGGDPPYSYDWGGADPDNLTEGIYNLVVTDFTGNMCSHSFSIDPPVLICELHASNQITCTGGSDGSLTVSMIGGSNDMTYEWSNGFNGQSQTELSAGTYTVTVTDNTTSCDTEASYVLNDPVPMFCNAFSVPTSCGNNNGVAGVSVSNGSGTYAYMWNSGQETATISNLAPGTYSVTVTDQNTLCTTVCSTTIGASTGLTCSITQEHTSCGLNNGSAHAEISGGSGNYSYNWSNGLGTSSISDLGPGVYNLIVTDINTGCLTSCSVSIFASTELSCNLNSTETSCGLDNGVLSAFISGGSGDFSYSWSNGSTASTIDNLSSGTYTLTVVDNISLCTAECSSTIEDSEVLHAIMNIEATSCGLDNGSINLSVSGGTGSYLYSWSNGSTDESLTALASGDYAVTVTDELTSCTSEAFGTIDASDALLCSIESTPTSCGLSNGSASLSVSGGSGNYAYNWSNGSLTQSLNALAAGNYEVTVTDLVTGCTSICNTLVADSNNITCNLISTDASCGLSNGSIIANVFGGSANYSFSWSTGSTSAFISGLASGEYTVTVVDNISSCSTVATINLGTTQAISCTLTGANTSCDLSNGTASVMATGGSGNYSYIWSNGSTVSSISDLSEGFYFVTVTDNDSGCSTNSGFEVSLNEEILSEITIEQYPSCNGDNNGRLSVSSSGGILPHSYNWGGINPLTLSAGTYTVTVTDAVGCTNTSQIELIEPDALMCSTSVISHVSCNGLSDGIASVMASGGTAPYSYDWGGEDKNALAAGSYVVTVTDSNGCTNTCDVEITEPDALSCSPIIIQNVSCSGINDGIANVIAQGGVMPYSYDWGTVDSNNLAAGIYTVTVTDANGCTSSCSIELSDPTDLSCTTMVIEHVSCQGLSDGRASAIASGGTAPYSYNWGGEDENALAAGTYVVTVTDANGCISTCEVVITEPEVLTCSTTVISQVSCNGLSDGQASVLGSGGTAPYSYNWGGEDENALAAGTYVVTVTDANGCTNTCDVEITEPEVLTCSTTVISQVSCNGFSNGRASVIASGGTSPYTYNWGGEDENALAAGSYVVTVTDSNGCVNTCEVMITEPTGLSCNATVINHVSCNGISDGRATVIASGGTAPYTYDWGGEDENALAAGTYVVTIMDANGCINTCDVVITEPDVLTCSTIVISQVSCNGMSDGQATVIASGGTAPYSYNWGGEDENALAAGTYVVTVTDVNGCINTCDVVITEPDVLTCGTTVISQVSCNGMSDGQATVIASGGTAPYIYDWGGEDENALAAGTYVVTVTDANGCVNTCGVVITEPTALTCSTAVINNVSCNGFSDGRASAIASGGTSPYTYDWGGEDENALAAGTYVVTVTDANGCVNTCDVVITEPTGLSCNTTVINNVSCNGFNDGRASVIASGGTAPYTYDWGGEDDNALAAGTYVVTVADANACITTCEVVITEPSELTCSTTVISDVSCNGLSDGIASVVASGGTGPYSYDWGGEDENALAAGTYIVTVTDANSCTNTCEVTITEPEILTCDPNVIQNVSCQGMADGVAVVNVTGGTTPYTYDFGGSNWNALSAGIHYVTITDANGCITSCSVAISEPSSLNCISTVIQNASCFGANDGIANIEATGGTAPYSYDWSGFDPNALSAGQYNVTISDSNGCTCIRNIEIIEPELLICSVLVENQITCSGGSDGVASIQITGGNAPYDIDWGGLDPQALSAGNYSVTVTDQNGCVSSCGFVMNDGVFVETTIAASNATCGESNGMALVNITGGSGDYAILWSNGSTNSMTSNLLPGSYSVSIVDNLLGCTSNATTQISNVGGITCDINHVDTSCGLDNGTASALVSGGSGNFSFSWSNGATTQSINALAAGEYQLTVSDNNIGCITICSVSILGSELLTSEVVTIDDVCGNGSGFATVYSSGGSGNYIYQWSNGSINQTLSGLNASTYIVTVTDTETACTSVSEGIVSEVSSLSCNVTVLENASCIDCADGSVDISITGGTAPYSYDWGGADPNALNPGFYMVTVSDINGCTTVCDYEIINESELSCGIELISELQCNSSSGAIVQALVSGGTPPYTYDWGGADPNDLAAGTYTLHVLDDADNECYYTFGIAVNEIYCNANTLSDASCSSSSDGEASLEVFGGSGVFEYLWSNGMTTATITGLAVGNYTVTVTDLVSQCTSTCTTSINVANNLNANIEAIQPDCQIELGSAEAIVTGGSGSYSYVWNDGSTVASISELNAGMYTVTVTDDINSCTIEASVEILDSENLSCIISTADASCEEATGSATVIISGGSGNYMQEWSNGIAGASISNLYSGIYTVTVTDLNTGCTQTVVANINSSSSFMVNIASSNPICGLDNGSAFVSISGGSGDYSYVWSNGETASAISSLTAGYYELTVTDNSLNCISVASITLEDSNPLQASISAINATCNQDNGSATVIVNGGSGNFDYLWSNGETSNVISGLAIGNYEVTVSDLNYACSIIQSVEIEESQSIQCQILGVDPVCGFNNGSAGVVVNGGTGQYSYTWNNGSTSQIITGLAPGTYSVTVMDMNTSCLTSCTVNLSASLQLTCSIDAIHADCLNGFGSANVIASGGSGSYVYNWNNGMNSQAVSQLAPGNYRVTVTDTQSQCTSICSTTILGVAPLSCSINAVATTCGEANGSAELTVTGGSGDYSYVWSSGAITKDIDQLLSGNYSVTVSDNQSACTTVCSVIVGSSTPLISSINTSDTRCGENNGSVDAVVFNGSGNYAYEWSNGFTTEELNSLPAGSYSLTVTDLTSGCTATSQASILQSTSLVCNVNVIQNASCNGNSDGRVTAEASGGIAPYSFDWGGLDPDAISAGSYTITVSDFVGCTSTCSFEVSENQELVCILNTIRNVECHGESGGQISVIVSGGAIPYSYDYGGYNFQALTAGTYTVTVTDGNGCTTTGTAEITEPPLLSCSINVIQEASCPSCSDAQVQALVSGGVAPYTYDWGGFDPNALVPGSYTLLITDANNCQSSCEITVGADTSLSCDIDLVNPVCYGESNGIVFPIVSGGVPPYEFDWGGADPNAIGAGSYTLVVTDQNNGVCVHAFTISASEELILGLTKINDVSCYGGSDGQVTTQLSGGTEPYDIDWGGFDPNALSAGTYVVTVTDANGCIISNSIGITEPTQLVCSISLSQDYDCDGLNNSSASVQINGGTEPYVIDWGIYNSSDLLPGQYEVSITDSNGCETNCSVDVPAFQALSCDLISIEHVSCYGANDGKVELSATGGLAPYDIDWGGANPEALEAGTYQVTITDQNACQTYCRIIVDQPEELTCSALSTGETCQFMDGTITLNTAGGTEPFNYSIDGGQNFQSSNLFEGLAVGSYELLVQDANGCVSTCQVDVSAECYDLALSKHLEGTGPYTVGSEIEYALIIENQGNIPAYNIKIQEEPQGGISYVECDVDSNPNVSEEENMIYVISSLMPGQRDTIRVTFLIEAGYLGTSIMNMVEIIEDDNDDIDSDPTTGVYEDDNLDGILLDDDEDVLQVEIDRYVEIGDYVWLDTNGNGNQESSESGVEGVEVELFNQQGYLVQRAYTNASGYYLFGGIYPGAYYLKFTYGDDYEITLADAGSNDSRDSDITGANGEGTTDLYNITENNYSIDAGLIQCKVISGTVWYDYNEDDIMDASENGINGIKVELYKQESGDWILWEVSYTGHRPGTPSDDGYYMFCPEPGEYYVRFSNIPETLVGVIPFAGSSENSSKVTGRYGIGTTEKINTILGSQFSNMNAGYYTMGSIGDYVWMDLNKNGIHELHEPGVSHVSVRAINPEGEIISQAISDDEGYYMLDYLGKDQYYIEIDLPSGLQLTLANIGNDDAMDSDIDGSNGENTSPMYSVSPGTHLPDIDIGLLENALPVEWLDFRGWKEGNKNKLEWKVTSELDVSHYTVERSLTGAYDFEALDDVSFRDTEELEKTYEYDDYEIQAGQVSYYRIKQVDYNGDYDYSKIISIQSEDFTFDEVAIGIYPNPAFDRVMLSFDHYTNVQSGELMFFTSAGEVVKKIQISDAIISPDRPYSVNISDLPSGVYSWLLVVDGFTVIDKLVIVD